MNADAMKNKLTIVDLLCRVGIKEIRLTFRHPQTRAITVLVIKLNCTPDVVIDTIPPAIVGDPQIGGSGTFDTPDAIVVTINYDKVPSSVQVIAVNE
jgi:hypothetical protein